MTAIEVPQVFIPLRELVTGEIENTGMLASIPGVGNLLGAVYYSHARVESERDASRYYLALGLFEGCSVQLPWLPGLEFRIGASEAQPASVIVECDIGERWSLAARGIPLSITFPPDVLALADGPNKGAPSSVSLLADVTLDEDLNVSFSLEDDIDLPLSNVAGTSIAVELNGLSISLSDADERRGISVREAKLRLPPDLLDTPLEISFEDFFIGEGGVSGRGSWTAPDSGPDAPVWNADQRTFSGVGTGNLFGSLPVSLRSVSVELENSIPQQADVVVHAFLPFFDQVVAIEVSLAIAGDLKLSLAAAQDLQPAGTTVSSTGLVSLRKEGLLEIALNGLTIARENSQVTLRLSGSLTPLFGGLNWPTFDIKGLTIDSTGHVTIDGGWIDVGKQGTIEFNGATLEIAKLGFGSEDDGTKWLGFSGGLKLADPLPVSGSVEGLRINWRGSDIWLELRGAAVGFEIPDSVKFAGHLEFVEDPVEPRGADVPKQRGFRGGGSLTIVPTNMKINAEVVVGRSSQPPPYPFGYLFVDFQTPVGIPMGLPNVAIYGFSGLLGLNMEPKKDTGQAWWEDWYLVPAPGVSSSTKWRPAREAFALGTGVTMGTAADNGYAVHGRLLLVLVLPGPTLLLEGVAGFLEDRTALGDDSPIHALAVLDTQAGQFLMNVQARYPFTSADPMNKLIQAHGGAEALFDAGGDWHFFLGERDPRNKRVVAEILQLFEARSYLMLFPDRVALGVWVGYDRRWKFGPLKVHLEAWMDANARISWRPVQFAGDLTLVGDLGLRAFGIGASLSVRTEVSAQAPAPYKVHAEIEAKLRTPRFIPDPKCHIEWDYEQPATPPILDPIGRLALEHLKVSEKWSLAEADMEAAAPVVPLDAKVAISFERSVEDAPLVGGTTVSGIPPWERSGQYEFAYRLTKVQLERRAKGTTGGAWETIAARTADDPQADGDRLWGVWLAAEASSVSGEPTPNAPMTKLLLHANSPFEYARENVDDGYFDHFTEFHPDYGWVRVTPPEPVCFNFGDLVQDKPTAHYLIQRGDVLIFGPNPYAPSLLVRPGVRTAPVYIPACVFVFDRGQTPTLIFFPEPVREVTLTFAGAKLSVRPYDGPTPLPEMQIEIGLNGVTIGSLDGPDWTSLALGDGTGCLTKVCYVTAEEADRYEDEQTTAAAAAGADDHYDDLPGAGLLLPQSYYRITVAAEGRRRRRGESDIDVEQFERLAYFQTADPPGVFDPPNAGGLAPDAQVQQYPATGALKDLAPYVGTTPDGERATTPANGGLAAYRGYDVGIELNEPYVEQMYLSDGMPLVLGLYDTNGVLVGSNRLGATTDAVPAIGSTWQKAEVQPERRSLGQYAGSAQIAHAQLATSESDIVTSAELAALSPEQLISLDTAIAYIAPVPDLSGVPPAAAIWTGGPDFILDPETLYRAALEAVRPAAVAHLDPQGVPLRDTAGDFRVDRVASDGSNLTQILDDPVGFAAAGPKVMTDGRTIIAYVQPGTPVDQRPRFETQDLRHVFKEMAGSLGEPSPTEVFYWNFTTSRFVTFLHHAHSFVDVLWDRRSSLDPPWPELQEEDRDALRDLVQGGGANETALFAKAASLFGVGPDPLPERLEVQILQDPGGRYGFLIESPEPLDWQRGTNGRVSVTVSRAPDVPPAGEPAFGAAKLIDRHPADGGWVDVLVRDDADLAGWTVEGAEGGPGAGALYHRFPAGSAVRAGAVLRLYAGDAPEPPADAEYVSLSTSPDPALLGAEAVVLSLKDALGREVHRRQFLVDASFTKSFRVRIAADADGTRTFVFLLDHRFFVPDLPTGTYRMAFTYRRTSAGQGRRLLRRNGFTASEIATLAFGVSPAEG